MPLPFFKFSHCRFWLEKVGRRLLGTRWQLVTLITYPTSRDTFKSNGPPQDLTEFITKNANYAVAHGGFGSVWKCTYHMGEKPINVAVKSIIVRTAEQNHGANEKTCEWSIERELRLWAMLEHVNILPLYGYTNGFGLFPALVSPWAENGNLTNYLELEYGRLTMVDKFNILRDVTAGVQYLHDTSIIHGDLTGANVLIRHDGTACIADFGHSLMYSEALGILSQASSSFHGTIRWMAPELFEVPEDGLPVCPSKQGDIYSFGGIMLLVLTGKIPYYYSSYEPAIIGIILRSVKPERARYVPLPDKYWEFIEECWSTDIQHRPSIERVVQMVRDELELIRAGAHA